MLKRSGALALAGFLVLAAACSSSGAGGRKIAITQGANGCTPASVDVTPGEKLQLVVTNESTSDYEVEGINGTNLEELIVPEGRTRHVGLRVPPSGAAREVKCYVPAGVTTIIRFVPGGGSATVAATAQVGATTPAATITETLQQPDATVAVTLASFSITPDRPSVKAGAIRFVATNVAKIETHELAVMRRGVDGTLTTLDEVESI